MRSVACLCVCRWCFNVRKHWPRNVIFGVQVGLRIFKSDSYIKVIGWRSRSQPQKSGSVYPVCGWSAFDWRAVVFIVKHQVIWRSVSDVHTLHSYPPLISMLYPSPLSSSLPNVVQTLYSCEQCKFFFSKRDNKISYFLPHSISMAILSVRPPVCLSVKRVHYDKTK